MLVIRFLGQTLFVPDYYYSLYKSRVDCGSKPVVSRTTNTLSRLSNQISHKLAQFPRFSLLVGMFKTISVWFCYILKPTFVFYKIHLKILLALEVIVIKPYMIWKCRLSRFISLWLSLVGAPGGWNNHCRTPLCMYRFSRYSGVC